MLLQRESNVDERPDRLVVPNDRFGSLLVVYLNSIFAIHHFVLFAVKIVLLTE